MHYTDRQGSVWSEPAATYVPYAKVTRRYDEGYFRDLDSFVERTEFPLEAVWSTAKPLYTYYQPNSGVRFWNYWQWEEAQEFKPHRQIGHDT